MELSEIVKSYVPGFFGSLFAAIFIAIVLGQNPINYPHSQIILLLFIFLLPFF